MLCSRLIFAIFFLVILSRFVQGNDHESHLSQQINPEVYFLVFSYDLVKLTYRLRETIFLNVINTTSTISIHSVGIDVDWTNSSLTCDNKFFPIDSHTIHNKNGLVQMNYRNEIPSGRCRWSFEGTNHFGDSPAFYIDPKRYSQSEMNEFSDF